MLKSTVLSLLGVVLFSLLATAQDAPEAGGPEAEGVPQVRRTGVVVLKEDDGEGEPQVIILEGDDLDAFELEHPEGLNGEHKARGKLRLADGDETFELDFDLDDGEGPNLEALKKRLKGLKGLKGLRGLKGMKKLLNPEARGEWVEQLKTQAKTRAKEARATKARAEREGAIEALKLDDETAAVLVPLLDRVLETQRRIAREDGARRSGLRSGPQDEAGLNARLAELRAASKKASQDLAAARNELRQLLTLGQEVELVLRGILD